MIVRDEEANLRRLLAPIHDLFDEVVVADTGSSDGTVAYLESIGARVVRVPWRDDFGAARTSSLRAVTADWVLWLDADDAFERGDVERLRRLVAASPPRTAYYLDLVNEGTRPAEASACHQLRVFPNLPGVAFEGRIHEQVAFSLQRLGVAFARAPIRVTHRGYLDRSIVRAKFERNRRILREELAERPDDPFLLYHAAQTCVGLGLETEALGSLAALGARRASEGVEREMARMGQVLTARLLAGRGDRDGSRAALEAALRDDPGHGLAALFLADQRLTEGDAAGAAALLQPIVHGEGLRPGALPYPVEAANEAAGLLLARALLALGRPDDAERAIAVAAARGGDGAALRARFADHARAAGFREAALAAYLAAAAEDPAAFEARFHAGTLLLDAGRIDDAERLLTEAAAIRPHAPECLVNRGNAALARCDVARARALYEEALAADPTFALAEENLAKAHLVSGRADKALAILSRIVARDPRRVDLLAHVGDIHLAAGRAGDAIRAFEAVLAAQPASHVTWTCLGDAYRALGALGAARLAWSRALAVAPDHGPARARLAALDGGAAPAGLAARPGAPSAPTARG
jgi:tetratricopeptide (TPR) repeat protein